MKSRKFSHYFLPHPETHQKAHLLSWQSLLIYVLLFILLRTSLDLVATYKPGVLGANSSITVQQIISDTNKERQKMGLPPVTENQALNQAALGKAKNMFEENYWAHFSPSGKDPWGFISSSGYKFSYAGENLARNFYNADDVVSAWMNSPSHRDNLLNSKYQDIGIAVLDGVLDGQKTTLVVQMFGRSFEGVAVKPEVNMGGQKLALEPKDLESRPILVEGSSIQRQNVVANAIVDPVIVIKVAGITIFMLIGALLLLDFVILKRRGVFRVSSHHLAHMGLLAASGATLLLTKAGEIL